MGKKGKFPVESRSGLVYRTLRDDLLRARIAPGQRIYESVIAERFEASRTPVREALQRLSSDGLLERQGRAYVIPEITFRLVENLYSVREALECKVIELLPESGCALDSVNQHLEIMDGALAAQDYHSFNMADLAFHLEIARATENDILIEHLGIVWDKVLLVRSVAFRQPARLDESLVEHRRIVDAIRRGRTSVALEEMRAHLRSVPAILKGSS